MLFALPCAILNVNLILTAIDGGVPFGFWVVYIVIVALPQLLGAKHRADGWMTDVVVP